MIFGQTITITITGDIWTDYYYYRTITITGDIGNVQTITITITITGDIGTDYYYYR